MTDVLEVLLELEYLERDLVHHPLKVDSAVQYTMLLKLLVGITNTILKSTISKDCSEHLQMISDGDMT